MCRFSKHVVHAPLIASAISLMFACLTALCNQRGMNDMLAEESIVLFVFSLFPALACACILKLSQYLEFGLKCGKPCAACDHYVAEEGLGIACCENGQLQVHNGRLQELQNQGSFSKYSHCSASWFCFRIRRLIFSSSSRFSCLIATPTGPYSCNWVALAIPKSLLKEVLLQKSYSAVLS
ncbi:uncharacterized protein LOC123894125 [Trifolium pratense]|uniref:uncharacterized protein LOC123894125 n=1 Tax=Trifolium pratense TaxID=57577 RepID=UPI001E692E1A|nr:uncharacterized protein LOC123894125 [Trifolium pratense]XP_045799976.1 uncharacterized protein LOC123894125 [Trifolium pratense]